MPARPRQATAPTVARTLVLWANASFAFAGSSCDGRTGIEHSCSEAIFLTVAPRVALRRERERAALRPGKTCGRWRSELAREIVRRNCRDMPCPIRESRCGARHRWPCSPRLHSAFAAPASAQTNGGGNSANAPGQRARRPTARRSGARFRLIWWREVAEVGAGDWADKLRPLLAVGGPHRERLARDGGSRSAVA